MALSFEWLIDPISPSTFFETYYEREPLLIARRRSVKYASLLSLDAIDHYLATASPTAPDVFLVDAARELKVEDYTFANSDPAGRLDLPRVYELFGSGATISLSQLHERLPQLAALCRAAEKRFSAHFQTNIYLSPPNAQGFKTHFDSHDVFVLQVAGSKLWTLHDTPIELPLRGQSFDPDKHVAGPPTREFTIRAGDLFYCPRGLLHSARATEEVSLHVTLGLIGKTWADVLVEAVSEACLASPEFRAHLPIGYAEPGFDKTRAEAKFRSLLDAFARNADLGPILERLADDFVRSRRPDSYGRLQELHDTTPITGDCKVEPRPHLIYRLREEGESIALLFGSSTITLPAFAGEPLAFALKGPPFVVREMPGRLDDPGKVVLVRRLIKEGLLVRCAEVVPRATAHATEAALAK
jgi:mannose-6-phosphate isomerase-like protein (cupin superfamily)